MKILHMADLHLGKKLNGYDLLDDQRAALQEVARIALEEKRQSKGPFAVAMTGDIYQTSIPTGESMTVLTEFLSVLTKAEIPVFMLSGNHDSDQRIAYLSPLLSLANVHVTTQFEGVLQTVTMTDDDGEVDIHMLPFIKPVQVRQYYPEETIETYEDALRVIIAHSPINPARRNVLLCHQCVTGSVEGGSEERIIGGSEDVGLRVFEPFDLVLLGHIHRPQVMKKERPLVSYAGSLLCYSVSEIGQEKSCSLITLGEKGTVPALERLSYPVRREMRKVEEYFDDLMELSPTEDLVLVILRDERPPMNYISSLRSVFRCLLEVRVKDIEGQLFAEQVEKEDSVETARNDMELFEEFYEWTRKVPLPEEEKELLKTLLEEGGEEA